MHGQVGVPGPLVRCGELQQDLGTLAGCAAGRAAFIDDLECAEVVRAGICMPEAGGGLPGREEGVFQGVLLCRCSRGQKMRRDPRGRTRPCLQRSPDRQVDGGSGSGAEAVEEGLAIEVMGEPRFGGAHDDTGVTGLAQEAQNGSLIVSHSGLRQQAEVDVAARDGRPFQQPYAFGGEPGQPSAQCLRDTGRDLGLLVPRALRYQQPGQLANEERVPATALPQLRDDLG